jgi:hypothetical protein
MNNDLQLNSIDTLGSLLAQIADLTAQADAIKDRLKDEATLPGGAKVFDGALFKATHSEANRSSVDWLKLIATKVGVEIGKKEEAKDSWNKVAIAIGFDQKEFTKAVADNTKTTAVFSIKVTAR